MASLVGFFRKNFQVLGYIFLSTMFKKGEVMETLKVKCMVVNAISSYNIVIVGQTSNALEVALSNLYLTMKYPLNN